MCEMSSKKMAIAMFGQKRIPSREGGVEIVVEELCTRMVAQGHNVTCYNRGGHHVSGSEYDSKRLKEYKGIKLKTVPTIEKKGLAAVSSSFFAALCCAFGKYDVVHIHAEGPAFFCWLPKLFHKRVIVTVHGIDWQREKWKSGFGSKFIHKGERTDLKDIVRELYKKSDRIVISTNGFFTDRIVDLAKEFPQIGIRISIEGLEKTNNEIRGLENGFQRGYSTLKKLREMGMKDVGFGMTVQDKNAPDLVPLYELSNEMGMEFATASLHNSFYFVEAKNIINDRPMVAKNFENLVNELLKSKSPKKWFRAYFNHGLINYIYGQKRLLPCDMSFDTFFIDPYGDVMPCNGTKDKEVMGNLNNQSWDELWNSVEAENVRKKVRCCDRDCWMIGSVSPAMHKYIWKPAWWVFTHKVKSIFGGKYSMYENKICREYRDGKVSKDELDKCSTCDKNCIVNNGLSEASKAQLVGKTGEEIVDADIKEQMKE